VTEVSKGKEKIRAFGTFANENNECILESYETKAPQITEWGKCVLVPEMPNYTLFGQMDIRLDPICARWLSGKLSDQSESKGWIKFKDNRPFDALSILLIADSFPPAVLSSQGMVAWVPTLEFSVNIRKIPTTNWLKCVFRSRYITCGALLLKMFEKGQILRLGKPGEHKFMAAPFMVGIMEWQLKRFTKEMVEDL
jgi:hypothetical protein